MARLTRLSLSVGWVLALVVLVLAILMWTGGFPASQEHLALLFGITALALLL